MIPKPVPLYMKRPVMPTSGESRCTVGLLTWNAGDEAFGMLRSLLTQTEEPFDLIWIDNASGDGTPQRLRQEFPDLPEPFINEKNMGFCHGHNQAMRACKTPYYLALNQDVLLAPDYIEKLCNWMDENENLAMTSGLIMNVTRDEPHAGDKGMPADIASAGLVFPRVRFPFDLGHGQAADGTFRQRRLTPGVNGAAMMLRLSGCRHVSIPRDEILADSFFAYHEEVDLAMRLARGGFLCGMEGSTQAIHSGFSSGGIHQPGIMAHYLSNHWLLTLRHDSWGCMVRESPWILLGEIRFWIPRYLKHPLAFLRALRQLYDRFSRARGFYHMLENRLGITTQTRLNSMRNQAREYLRKSRDTCSQA